MSDSAHETWKEDFLLGVIDYSNDYFKNIESMVECSLAGCEACVVTTSGEVNGTPVRSKIVYLWNQEEQSLGGLVFGQTTNALFDYSQDFAEIVASATRA